MKTEIELIMRDGAAEERAGATNLAPQTDDDVMDAYSRAVITAAERVSPSVVYIEVEQRVSNRRPNIPRMPQERRGSGSGFIFTLPILRLSESMRPTWFPRSLARRKGFASDNW